ncbi:MAG: hypothetical protein Kow0010_00670 [Dehalococcoidia bacterium]
MRWRGVQVVVAVAVMVAGLASWPGTPARADGEIEVRVVAVDDSAFPTITAVFTADLSGTPLGALDAAAVEVVESGEPATVDAVRSITDAGIPLAMVVTVDLSGSMAGEPLARARDAVSALVRSLGPEDAVGLLTFADTVTLRQPLTTDKAAAAAVVTSFAAAGNTALYDAVAQAAELAASSTLSRRAVVLVSDGEDFGGQSAVGRDGSLEAAAASGVPFYVVGLGAEIDRGYLEELAVRTRGRFFEAPLPGDVPSIYAALETLLRSQFVVSVTSSAPPEVFERDIVVLVRTADGTGEGALAYRSVRTPPASTATATVPPPATPASTPEPTPTPALAAVPGVTEGGGGGGGVGWALPVAGLALAVPGIALFVVLRRRKPEPADDTEPSAAQDPLPGPIEAERTRLGPRPRGRLEIGSGRRGVDTFDLPPHLVAVGTGESCAIRLAGAEGVAAEHFRLWWRDGHPVLHHVAPGAQTLVNGKPVVWASLRDGDEIWAGTVVMTYRELPPEALEPAK